MHIQPAVGIFSLLALFFVLWVLGFEQVEQEMKIKGWYLVINSSLPYPAIKLKLKLQPEIHRHPQKEKVTAGHKL